MTGIQKFFFTSGVIYWALIIGVTFGFIAYRIKHRNKEITVQKGKTLNLTGFRRYNKNGKWEG